MASRDRTPEFLALVQRAGGKPLAARVRDREQQTRLVALARATLALDGQMVDIPARQAVSLGLHAARRAQETSNDQQRLHFCIVEQMLLQKNERLLCQTADRGLRLTGVERRLYSVSRLFDVVAQMVADQGDRLDLLEQNVERISLRVDASADQLYDAAPRTYRTKQNYFLESLGFPRARMARMRLVFFCVVALNICLAVLFF